MADQLFNLKADAEAGARHSWCEHSVAGAFGGPAQRRHLDFHASPAGGAVARRFHCEAFAAAVVNVRRRAVAAVGRYAAVPTERSGGAGG
ncbi:UNVERIFIED_ORG: hypothetical protein ABIB13_003815 [Arthrobacter sp. UYEF2]